MESAAAPKEEKTKLEGEEEKIFPKNFPKKKKKNWSTPSGIERETPIFQKFFR